MHAHHVTVRLYIVNDVLPLCVINWRLQHGQISRAKTRLYFGLTYVFPCLTYGIQSTPQKDFAITILQAVTPLLFCSARLFPHKQR